MSEKNNIFENDLLMRAILESGQEEVPDRVWDAVSDKLDEVAGNKVSRTVTLWLRRAGVAMAAAAAVIAAILIVGRNGEAVELVPIAAEGDMIAVVEPEDVVSQTSGAKLLAYAPEVIIPSEAPVVETITESIEEPVEKSVEEPVENTGENPAEVTSDRFIDKTYKNSEVDEWQSLDSWEEEVPARHIKTSFTVSGLTGNSGSKNSISSGPLKAPAVILMPSETGIREKENQTHYGVPVAVGTGIRIEFTPRWSLGVGLNYTHLSRVLQGTYTHINEAGSIDDMITSQIRNSQHYLGLPVNAYFSIIDSRYVTFYTYAGGTAEKCLSDSYHILGNNVTHKEAVKGVQLSAAAGLGAEITLTDHLGIYIDPSLRYYFDCNQPKSIRTAQPLMFNAEVGLRFRL